MRMFDPSSIVPSRQRGRARLARLAEFLETVEAGDLTFSRWYGLGKGCAVGLAAMRDPWFRAEGLRLSEAERFGDCGPVYGGLTDWEAVYAFFAIGADDAAALFTARGYGDRLRPAPAEVAARIRGLLAADEIEADGIEADGIEADGAEEAGAAAAETAGLPATL